mgnify:CR=1 FL=1
MILNNEKFADGLYKVNHKIFKDERGTFEIIFNNEVLSKNLLFNPIQSNIVKSKLNVFRGMHFQTENYSQNKLVTVIKGEIDDYVVDLRKNSQTFLKTFKINISEFSDFSIFISKGFAHGYHVKSEYSIVQYHIDNYYSSIHERTINFRDKKINIFIKNDGLIISSKDNRGIFLDEYLKENKF